MYTMLHIPAKIPSAAFDLAPQCKTTTVCLGFCFHTSSMYCMQQDQLLTSTLFVPTVDETLRSSPLVQVRGADSKKPNMPITVFINTYVVFTLQAPRHATPRPMPLLIGRAIAAICEVEKT